MTADSSTTDRPYREVLLTGVTGFLGQAVLQAFLEHYPDVRVTSVVRPKGTQSGKKRLEGLLRKPVFTSWAERTSKEAVRAAFDERCDVLEGDLTDMPELDRTFDVVIHSASSVSFDPPINEAFATNVGGAKNLYEALHASATTLEGGQDPHVIHVSTAYVSGLAKGLRQEGRLSHEVSWRDEYEAALAAAHQVDELSRTPEVLKKHMLAAELKSGKMGPKAIASVAEADRRDWIRTRLQEYGLRRANSLGWTDIYTFTKAMAERVGEELWADTGHRLSFVRPAIIESAVRFPFPGWIDGYKVADPLIMAYGKGRLPEFPGLADSILDIIPVDHIVNVILALATQDVERRGDDAYFQVVSGHSNPLPLHEMVSVVHDYFSEHPLQDDDGSIITVPEWTFPSVDLVEARFWATRKAAGIAQVAVGRLPGTPTTRRLAGKLHKSVASLEMLRKFMDLYRSYTKTEMVFDDANTRALRDELPAEFLATHDFDITAVDWHTYFREQHLPAITELTKAHSRQRAALKARADRAPAPLTPATNAVAVFDLDGTVIAQNVVQQYLAIVKATRPRGQWASEIAKLAGALPQYLRAESRDRSEFIRSVNRRYRGFTTEELQSVLSGELGERIRRQIKPLALQRIEEHRAAGHRTVLVTGALDILVEPIAELFDDVVATRMHEENGTLTGYLATPPVVAEARANWLRKYANKWDLDLSISYGYGDSHADAAWLALVGTPAAISPDLGLYAEAKKNRWQVLDWK
ncbi:MAG: HAD-IB family hydrolase [Dermabacter sp.]|nr:HAD-IB family hydrolase [Dermabacter sp.]